VRNKLYLSPDQGAGQSPLRGPAVRSALSAVFSFLVRRRRHYSHHSRQSGRASLPSPCFHAQNCPIAYFQAVLIRRLMYQSLLHAFRESSSAISRPIPLRAGKLYPDRRVPGPSHLGSGKIPVNNFRPPRAQKISPPCASPPNADKQGPRWPFIESSSPPRTCRFLAPRPGICFGNGSTHPLQSSGS